VVGLVGAVSVAVAIGAGCTAEVPVRTAHGPATPLVASSSLAPSTPPVAAAESAAPLGIESFTPLLLLPGQEAVADALDSGDAPRAVRELVSAIAKHPPTADDAPRFQLLLARLREDAGDAPGALAAYTVAAAGAWPLASYAALDAGRILVRLGRAEEAAAFLSRIPPDQPIFAESELLLADADVLRGKTDDAILQWRAYLAKNASSSDAIAVSMKLAEALLAAANGRPDAERQNDGREALGLARIVLARVPTDTALVARAESAVARSLALLSPAERAERQRPTPEEELDRVKTLVDDKDHEAARDAADALLASLGAAGRSGPVGCEADVLRARSLAGLREWGKGADVLTEVARRCKDPDVRARALFLAGKYADSDKRYAFAIQSYEQLEKELPEHRLADDARLRAALDYSELGAEGRFTDLLTRMPDDYPGGDMVLDGLFELAVHRIDKGDWSSASTVLARAADLARPLDAKRGQEFSGRERYFLARASAIAGDLAKSLDEYESLVTELPFSYYMLNAYSRLRDADPARAQRAVDRALERSLSAPFEFEHRPEFELPGFHRALELLRVGDAVDAQRELRQIGADAPDATPPILWSVALLYARAGAAKLSNDIARGLLTDWPARWPSGDWARAWQVAFPRPYHPLVMREAKRNAVPESLVYAVMREESSFDPAAESPAKAYGLMQLIEPTARLFGKGIGLRPDAALLKRPVVNVAIGCRVLADLTKSFPENSLLAIPGYNAGAGRPKHWLVDRPGMDFDVWVELIPFQETRRYTKRVLSSRAAYAFLYDHGDPSFAMTLPLKASAAPLESIPPSLGSHPPEPSRASIQ